MKFSMKLMLGLLCAQACVFVAQGAAVDDKKHSEQEKMNVENGVADLISGLENLKKLPSGERQDAGHALHEHSSKYIPVEYFMNNSGLFFEIDDFLQSIDANGYSLYSSPRLEINARDDFNKAADVFIGKLQALLNRDFPQKSEIPADRKRYAGESSSELDMGFSPNNGENNNMKEPSGFGKREAGFIATPSMPSGTPAVERTADIWNLYLASNPEAERKIYALAKIDPYIYSIKSLLSGLAKLKENELMLVGTINTRNLIEDIANNDALKGSLSDETTRFLKSIGLDNKSWYTNEYYGIASQDVATNDKINIFISKWKDAVDKAIDARPGLRAAMAAGSNDEEIAEALEAYLENMKSSSTSSSAATALPAINRNTKPQPAPTNEEEQRFVQALEKIEPGLSGIMLLVSEFPKLKESKRYGTLVYAAEHLKNGAQSLLPEAARFNWAVYLALGFLSAAETGQEDSYKAIDIESTASFADKVNSISTGLNKLMESLLAKHPGLNEVLRNINEEGGLDALEAYAARAYRPTISRATKPSMAPTINRGTKPRPVMSASPAINRATKPWAAGSAPTINRGTKPGPAMGAPAIDRTTKSRAA